MSLSRPESFSQKFTAIIMVISYLSIISDIWFHYRIFWSSSIETVFCELVDTTGRIIQANKVGAIDSEIIKTPIVINLQFS